MWGQTRNSGKALQGLPAAEGSETSNSGPCSLPCSLGEMVGWPSPLNGLRVEADTWLRPVGDLDGLPTPLMVLFAGVLDHALSVCYWHLRSSSWVLVFLYLVALDLPQLHMLAVNFSPLCILFWRRCLSRCKCSKVPRSSLSLYCLKAICLLPQAVLKLFFVSLVFSILLGMPRCGFFCIDLSGAS